MPEKLINFFSKEKYKFKNKQLVENQQLPLKESKTSPKEKIPKKMNNVFHTQSFQIDSNKIEFEFQRQRPLSARQKNIENLSQSLREFDYSNKNDFVEIKDYIQNPQEQTMNSARSKSQDENSQYEATKVSSRSVSLNQSILNCLICYDKPPDAVIMECGHGGEKNKIIKKNTFFLGLCYECSIDIWKKNGECYLCRQV